MNVGDVIEFKRNLFFDGAIQLRWFMENIKRSNEVASNFVFHGPRYHGESALDDGVIDKSYNLKDTATFINYLSSIIISDEQESDQNPFCLAVAGYGSGKSHLAVTIAELFGKPKSSLTDKIIDNVKSADNELGEKLSIKISKLKHPTLVIALDGTSNFHLGNEISKLIIDQLKLVGADLSAIQELSPRFLYAENFVQRNYSLRVNDFEKMLPNIDCETICTKLQTNNENIFEAVDNIYEHANGTRIPIEGKESAQDLINTVCETYCGADGPFSNIIILFDEFGRYLEYVAEKPLLAGDFALQQIFQGIQDNSDKASFVGFIQYELKAYLKKFNRHELLQLQRYITRYDAADKLYLSTNLETLIAHLIKKKEIKSLEDSLNQSYSFDSFKFCHSLLLKSLPSIKTFPIWNKFERFFQIIAVGCWPLHPLTTWFLTQQQDIVQSRSALSFIEEAIKKVSSKKIVNKNGELLLIYTAELVLDKLLPEIIASERMQGGNIADILQSLLERHATQLKREDRLALAGIMILDKLRIQTRVKQDLDEFLILATGLDQKTLLSSLISLSGDIGAIEWNQELGQYELIADAATRGQFQKQFSQHLSQLSPQKVDEIFVARGKYYIDSIVDIETDFGEIHEISTREWKFSVSLANISDFKRIIKNVFGYWYSAELPDSSKGQVIYLYLNDQVNLAEVKVEVEKTFNDELKKLKVNSAPIWLIHIHDQKGTIAEYLKKIHVLESELSDKEQEIFGRFIPEEKKRSLQALDGFIADAIRERQYQVAGIAELPVGRLKVVGQSIFENIYPEIIPFPFDGFATKNGAGAADCAQLIRALVGRIVSGSWLSTQPERMRNRVTKLFVHSWEVLGSDGTLRRNPDNIKVAKLYKYVEEYHKENPQHNLGSTYKALMKPPYGLNASSAGALLGYLLAQESPPRALRYNGSSCSLEGWLEMAFPASRGKHWFETKVLDQTYLIFLEEDSVGRWRSFLREWEDEIQFEGKKAYFKEAQKKLKEEPIPETLEDKYQLACEHTAQSLEHLSSFESFLDKTQKILERAEKHKEFLPFLIAGSKLINKKNQLLDSKENWSETHFQDIEKILDVVSEFVEMNVDNWTIMQVVNSVHQIIPFRDKIEQSIKSLNLLGFESSANKLRKQKSSTILMVEDRNRFATTLRAAEDFLRIPVPGSTSNLKKLREDVRHAEKLSESIVEAEKKLKTDDIPMLRSGIKERINAIRLVEQRHQEELNQAYNAQVNSLHDIQAMVINLNNLLPIFYKTSDEDEIKDLLEQLTIFENDIVYWNNIEASPEELNKILSKKIAERCKELSDDEEKDYFWEFQTIYQQFLKTKVDDMFLKSQQWIDTLFPIPEDISEFSLEKCNQLCERVSNTPIYLSKKEKKVITDIKKQIESRKKELLEIRRQEQEREWFFQFNDLIKEIDKIEEASCLHLLQLFENPPFFISKQGIKIILSTQKKVNTRLDRLDLAELEERIIRLPKKLQQELIKRIKSLITFN